MKAVSLYLRFTWPWILQLGRVKQYKLVLAYHSFDIMKETNLSSTEMVTDGSVDSSNRILINVLSWTKVVIDRSDHEANWPCRVINGWILFISDLGWTCHGPKLLSVMDRNPYWPNWLGNKPKWSLTDMVLVRGYSNRQMSLRTEMVVDRSGEGPKLL